MDNFLKVIDDFVWGVPLIVLILAVGVYLTIRLMGLQITKLPLAVKLMFANDKKGEGETSSFGALCVALSATIGTGNIVGVATAIVAGGPGALFWMWIAALLGTATKYAECLLAIKYRVVEEDGHVGAGLLSIGTFTQINGITSAVNNFFDPNNAKTVELFGMEYSWSVVIAGVILTLCAALVIIGGVKRISKVAEFIVPFMAILYIVAANYPCICHSGSHCGYL